MTRLEKIAELRKRGFPLEKVAEILGYKYSTVATYCHKYNIRSGVGLSEKKSFPAELMKDWDETRKKLLGIEETFDFKKIYGTREDMGIFCREWDKARFRVLKGGGKDGFS